MKMTTLLGTAIALLFTANALAWNSATDKPMMVFTCHGRSMYPTIVDGQQVLVDKVSFGELKAGDIVVYDNIRLPFLVCHRLVRRADYTRFHFFKPNERVPAWTVRGDNNRADDVGLCVPENYIGRVEYIIPLPAK